MVPDWWVIKEIIDKTNESNGEVKKQVDLIFDEEYQARQKLELEELQKVFNEYKTL